MRDDVFDLTRAERRAARAGWRLTSLPDRREACRLAEQGLPARDPEVSAAARRWGECLLQKNWSNRLPRWLLPSVGLLVILGGVLLTRVPGLPSVGVVWMVAGAVMICCGLLSRAQRRAGHALVRANPVPSEDVVRP